jgi:type VI secretion system secreted protein Hcp
MGSGAGAGKVSVQDISFTHYIDKASPTLMLFCCNGKHMKKGKLIVRKAGENPLEYLTVELEDILVSHVSTGGSHGEDRLTENVTLNFAKFKLEYVPQQENGAGGKRVEAKWDIPANQ